MLPGFPKASPPPRPSGTLRQRGISLRGATLADLPFLQDLYAGFRAAELALAPWSPEQRRAFTDDQFRLQHLHFTRHHARANFWVIEQTLTLTGKRPIGRLYLDRSRKPWHIVEIGFATEARGQGLGTAMLSWLQERALEAKATGLMLSVAVNNPRAEMLYRRMGFVPDGETGPAHLAMRWRGDLS